MSPQGFRGREEDVCSGKSGSSTAPAPALLAPCTEDAPVPAARPQCCQHADELHNVNV